MGFAAGTIGVAVALGLVDWWFVGQEPWENGRPLILALLALLLSGLARAVYGRFRKVTKHGISERADPLAGRSGPSSPLQ